MDLKTEAISGISTDLSESNDKLAFVNDWFLMGSPIPVILTLVAYLTFVLKIGPDYMKNRKPLKLQNTLLVYNAIQVCISYFLLHKSIIILWNHGLLPKTCVMDTDANRKLITSGIYYYFLAKVTELLDTVFFVFRKKNSQISFLHVYHHTFMAFASWSALKYEPSFIPVFVGTCNAFVHILMYSYYGLSAFPSLVKYLWWKKYITRLQLVQFVSIFIHFAAMCIISECKPSMIYVFVVLVNISLFIYLFSKFYIETYVQKNKDSKIKVDEKISGETHNIEKDNNGNDSRKAIHTNNFTIENCYTNGIHNASQAMKRK